MDEILSQIREFRKEIEKVKVFCAYVAAEHEDIPQLKQLWNIAAGNFIYEPNTRYNEMDSLKAVIMKALLELEDRIAQLEEGKRRPD